MRILWLGGVLGLVLGARPAVAADTLSGVLEVKFREGLAIRVRGGVPMEMTGGGRWRCRGPCGRGRP